ncbi:branched-chain amino acid ABC transporter permease [Modestobacter altitudinis]|uniref:branched-chain amino acid ABC transporter permease n=1 Tax=Modestobacter altitudinis TaxID=2213158 RepID=UPI00110CE1F9|nr:branched-chain amino acid ABC transporter permease [Modestobacter altitudinis]
MATSISEPAGAVPATQAAPGAASALTTPGRVVHRPIWRRPVTWAWTALFVVGLLLPFLISDYDLFKATRVLTIAIAVAGLNLLIGRAGQISAGHGALYGLGAYTAMILVKELDWAWPLAVLAAVAVSGVAGWLIGLPALRVRGLNLGLLTIAIAAVFPLLLNRFSGLTGGTVGLQLAGSPITPPESWGLTPEQFQFLLLVLVVTVVLVVLRNLSTGPLGRSIEALRVNPLMARSEGVDVNRLTLTVFGISSAVAGLGGALGGLVLASTVPDSYSMFFSLTLLSACVVGGSRTWAGALLGAAFIVYLPDLISQQIGSTTGGQWSQLVYAAALLLTLFFLPSGVAGGIGRLLARSTRRPERT